MDAAKAMVSVSMVAAAAIVGGQHPTNHVLAEEGRGVAYHIPIHRTLTDGQRAAIRLKVQEIREAEASQEEIEAEIDVMLQEWRDRSSITKALFSAQIAEY